MSTLAGCSGGAGADVATIGALLPLTGALSSYGVASQAALDVAVAASNGKIKLVVRDTTTNPQTALVKLQELKELGIRVVIGPYPSSEVRAVKAYADTEGIVLLSPLSTSRKLAIPGDNIFRFTPDDTEEGAAVAALAFTDGVRTVIPISRDDEGNLGLQASFKPVFESLGGTATPLITYGADQTDFTQVVADLARAVEAAQSTGQKAGVYLTAFGEVKGLFAAATAGNAILKTVTWYGSDGVALDAGLPVDATAAAFAVAVGYPNPILGLSDADKFLWEPVIEAVEAKIGRVPDAFALAGYDALEVAQLAMSKVGKGATASQLASEIVSQAATHRGLTGISTLNAAGDRSLGNYDFWSVCPSGKTFTWGKTAVASRGTTGYKAQRLKGC